MARMIGAPDLNAVSTKLAKLQAALAGGSSREQGLRRWSAFIRERDSHRCVDCHSREGLAAHHICRKSLFAEAQFQTGNGITLCGPCHRNMHHGFNARPDLSLPVDAQGGEKLATMERLYSILTDDAVERHLVREDFYFLSDELLASFKRMQGFDPKTFFPGSRIEQAYLILAECEQSMRHSMVEANGLSIPHHPLLPGGMYLVLPASAGQPQERIIVQCYVPRSKPTIK
jgi:hypothetical protein